MPQITVTAKGNLGWSPVFGEIIAGQKYTIDEKNFAPELFERPAKTNVNSKGGDLNE
jgi:hypothetical protein